MKIVLDPLVMLKLETYASQTRNEFSGFGFVDLDREHQIFHVYDVVILDVGTYTWTEIPSRKILEVIQRPDARKMKLWFHRHPMGNGIPGMHNWSGTDDNTCRREPLGNSMPELVGWSISIVRTPLGWVGRYDTYGPNGATAHLNVEPSFALEASRNIFELISEHSNRRGGLSEMENDWDDDPDAYLGLDGDDDLDEEEEGSWDDEDEEDVVQTSFLGGMLNRFHGGKR
jgi:hypothetical protein